MNEPGDEENDLDKVAEPQARESDTSKDIIIKNIDKTHPISKTGEKGLQRRIVKFTLNSFKEKSISKIQEKQRKIIEDQKKKTTTNQS